MERLGEWEPEPRLVRPEVLSDYISSALKDIKAVSVWRSVGTTRRAGRSPAAVGVLGHGSGKVQGGESQIPRRGDANGYM